MIIKVELWRGLKTVIHTNQVSANLIREFWLFWLLGLYYMFYIIYESS